MIFCKRDGFTCEDCGCPTKQECEFTSTVDKANEVMEALKIQIEGLNYMAEFNSTEILNKYRDDAKELKKLRKLRSNEVLDRINKLIERDAANFQEQYREVKLNLKKRRDPLDKAAREYEAESKRAIKLLEALETDKEIADIIRGYEYWAKAEKIELKEEKNDYTEFEGQVAALKGFQGELDEIEAWLEKVEKSAAESNKILYSIMNGGSEIAYNDLSTHKSHKYKSKNLKQIPFYCGVAASKGSIYIAGGTHDMVEYLENVWNINIRTGVEEKLPNLITPRSENTLVVTRNYMVCIGGRNSEDFVEDIELFNPLLDKIWKRAAKLVPARSFVSAVSCEECKVIYMFGGLGRINAKLVPVNCFSKLDLRSHAIKDLTVEMSGLSELPELHSSGIVCAAHKSNEDCKLIIFGGIDKERKETKKVYALMGTNKDSGLDKESFISFNFEAMEDLRCADTFYGQLPIFSNNNQIQVISRKQIHLYNFENRSESKISALYEYLTL